MIMMINAIRKYVSMIPKILKVILSCDKIGFQTEDVFIMRPLN